jgi:hypothetical protein
LFTLSYRSVGWPWAQAKYLAGANQVVEIRPRKASNPGLLRRGIFAAQRQ